MRTRSSPARPALPASPRTQSRAEEWANAASHALGVLLACGAWPWLADAAARLGGSAGVVAVGLFVATMVLQYGVSTLYHALPHGRAKLWARAADHAAIYLFIAGSATPFSLGLLGGTAGAATCALIWTLALAGAWLKLCRRLTGTRLSTGLYVLFGWLALLLVWPDLQHVDPATVGWLLGGGAAYLVGAGFFLFDASLRFGHFIWHVFALAGSSCHVCAALWPALG
jgi:hemolysin III